MPITLRENMWMVYQHKTPEYLPLGRDIQLVHTVEPGHKAVVYERKQSCNKNEIDWFGQNWVYEPMIKAYNPDATNYIIKDITRWRDYVSLPDVDAVDWKARFDVENFERDENRMLLLKDRDGLWERAFLMVPITDLLCALIEEPEACEDFFSTIADHKIKLHNHYLLIPQHVVLRLLTFQYLIKCVQLD